MTHTGQTEPRIPAPHGPGQSRQDLIGQALAAPGALLHSTTKPDLLAFAALATSRIPARPTARRN
jgi:hypothetical protein